MPNVLKATLSVFLLLTLLIGVLDTYYQVFPQTDQMELSDLSDGDEEGLKKEEFQKRILYQEYAQETYFFLSHRIVRFWLTPACLLEGHTGQVTPPPWA